MRDGASVQREKGPLSRKRSSICAVGISPDVEMARALELSQRSNSIDRRRASWSAASS